MPNEQLKYKLKEKTLLSRPKIIVIGSSTGGSKALEELFSHLKGKTINIPILVTQHIPRNFTDSLVEQIVNVTDIPCLKAEDGMIVEGGKVYIAPGGKHMLVEKQDDIVKIKLDDGPAVNFCKPAVDPMINSAVEIYQKSVFAIILTGMGNDGLAACMQLAEAGGTVIAQDEDSSIVWGMPGAVAKAGICSAVLPVKEIAEYLIKYSMGAIN